MRIIILAMIWSAHSAQIEKVDFPDKLTVGGNELLLNGVGLRTKRKLGMDFRVYVAGLYVTKKSSDSAILLADHSPKVIDMVFLRSVDKDTLQDSWRDSLKASCKQECEQIESRSKSFLENLQSVKDKSRLRLSFDSEGLTMKTDADKDVRLADPKIANAIFAVFVGDNPPTPELKKGLLGQ